MKFGRTCSLQLELMFLHHCVDNRFRVLACNHQVVGMHRNAFAVISFVAHPNVFLTLGCEVSHLSKDIS